MKKKIIFQKCQFNYFYFLLYILTYVIWLIIEHYLDLSKIESDKKEKFYFYINKEILEIYALNISDFIAIIPYFISKKISQSNNNKKEDRSIEDENKEKAELIYNESNQSSKIKLKPKTILLYLILIAAFDFLDDFMFVLYYIFFPEEEYHFFPFNYSVIFDIIIQFLFSYLILKIHFYKLQYFSLYLNVIICITLLRGFI